MTGPDASTAGQNGDRAPAPMVLPPGGQRPAPGFPPHPPGAPFDTPAALFMPDLPLWALIFGGM